MRVIRWTTASRIRRGALAGVLVGLLQPALASAHIERASYWPDPAPDCSITPCAGGAVPTPKTLESALEPSQAGSVRVVCQKRSMKLLNESIKAAETVGYVLRPTQP